MTKHLIVIADWRTNRSDMAPMEHAPIASSGDLALSSDVEAEVSFVKHSSPPRPYAKIIVALGVALMVGALAAVRGLGSSVSGPSAGVENTASPTDLDKDGVISLSSSEIKYCSSGILSPQKTVCCAASCGQCGGPSCQKRPGGGSKCCKGRIAKAKNNMCKHSEDEACLMPVYSDAGPSGKCWSNADCEDDKIFGNRDKCIKKDCEKMGLIYPDHFKHVWERCDSGFKLPRFMEYRGLCVEEFWSDCHSHENCKLGGRDECIKKDCEDQGMTYPSTSKVWEKCSKGLDIFSKTAEYKGLCE